METHALDLGDYVIVLKRRRLQLLIPIAVVLLATVALAFGLPAIYRSTATILIEQQDIPQDLVRSTVTSYATERIQTISQRVMTRENLQKIVEKYNLFQKERESINLDDIITQMRQNIDIQMVSADVTDPKSGRESKATIAFDLSFDSKDAEASKEVADELASLFLKENIRLRSQMAGETSAFLSEEANRLSAHIADLEAQLATFKEKNTGQLPQLMQLNMSMMDRTVSELESTELEISNLEQRKVGLEAQLAQLEPNTGESPEGRLRVLQMAYLKASATYSPDHPDIINMRREIDSLKAQIGQSDNTSSLEQQILKIQANLAVAREKYSEDHPDVIALKKSLAALNDDLVKLRNNGNQVVANSFQPDNPAYVSTKTQLESIKISLAAAQQKRERLKVKQADYESRIVQTPKVEQQGMALSREYDNAVQKYHETKQKLLEAQVAVQLENENKGERFSLIEPPFVPSSPYKPNRPGILLLGVVLSLVSGLGFAAVSEYLDQTVRGSRGVSLVMGSPPIVAVPYMEVAEAVPQARNRMMLVGLIVLTVLILGLLMMQAFWAGASG